MSHSAPHIPATIRPLLRELRARLDRVYGDRLHTVVLYGSHARNEATEASDVDVMVVLEGEVHAWEELQRMSEPVYDLELETEEMITLFPISRSEFENHDTPLLMNVHREGVEV